MSYYKPDTLEENLANIRQLKVTFIPMVNHLYDEFNTIQKLGTNQYFFSQAIYMGFINYNWNYELAMSTLAYSVYGFTNDVYNRIAYALDFINRSKQGRSIKNYERDISNLANKKSISISDKQVLVGFKAARNYGTHYGKVVFVGYIFNNISLIYNIINFIDIALSEFSFNEVKYNRFLDNQYDFIYDLKQELQTYEFYNIA